MEEVTLTRVIRCLFNSNNFATLAALAEVCALLRGLSEHCRSTADHRGRGGGGLMLRANLVSDFSRP